MKGFLEKELINGKVSYDKIQIKEVTSHYLNGCVSMIIFPNPPKVEFKGQVANSSTYIDFAQIKPLILDKIIVKAKKMKKSKNKDIQRSLKYEDGRSGSLGEERQDGKVGQNKRQNTGEGEEIDDEEDDDSEENEAIDDEEEQHDNYNVNGQDNKQNHGSQEIVQNQKITEKNTSMSNQIFQENFGNQVVSDNLIEQITKIN